MDGKTLAAIKEKTKCKARVGPGCYDVKSTDSQLRQSFPRSLRNFYLKEQVQAVDQPRLAYNDSFNQSESLKGRVSRSQRKIQANASLRNLSVNRSNSRLSSGAYELTNVEFTPGPGAYEQRTDFGVSDPARASLKCNLSGARRSRSKRRVITNLN